MPRSVVSLPALEITAHAGQQLLNDGLVLALRRRHHGAQKVGVNLGSY